MSLSGSLQIANNSLLATQIGLQVVGQNIANANTPGYIRETVNYVPAPTQQIGGLNLGLGVQVAGISQQIDNLLEQRLRNSTSDAAGANAQADAFTQLEGLTNELGDKGLAKSLSNFLGSINNVLNQPEDASVRNLTVLQGKTLASNINSLSVRTNEVRDDFNNRITTSVDQVNGLLQTIADLNVRITRAEGGNNQNSPAVGLRDQRNVALASLAKLVDINVQEQSNGAVSIYVGGDFLVLGNEIRKIKLQQTAQGDQLQFVDNNALLQTSSGLLPGLVTARDKIVGGFQTQLDDFAHTLAFEFNKIHSSGQGLHGYQTVTSQSAVTDANRPLDAAGLENTPVNGSFQLQLFNKQTGQTTSTNVSVELNGLDHDTTLNDLAAQINAVSGVSATIDTAGHLTIKTNTVDQQIAFANDTSGALAALGINTFFTGNSAATLGVNQALVDDPSKFAASSGGIAADTSNAVKLAAFADQPLETQGNSTISQIHDRIINNITEGSAQAQSVANGLNAFNSTLQSQSLAISGVNIDEETVSMLTLQRSYQASAKFISTINELMGVLVNL